MPRLLKITLTIGAALIALACAAISILAATFDPNAYKALLIEYVQRDKQRALAIPDPIRLRLFPKLGVDLGALSLSESGSAAPFASLQSAHVSLALLPLLRQQVVVDRIELHGLRANLRRDKDGRMNIDDLLRATPRAGESAAPQPVHFDISGVHVSDASITIDDHSSARRVELTRAELRSGRLAPGTAAEVMLRAHVKTNAPAVDAGLRIQAELLLDPAAGRYALRKLLAELDGDVAALPRLKAKLAGSADVGVQPLSLDARDVELTVRGQPANGVLEADFKLPQLKFSEKDIAAKAVDARLTWKQGARTFKAHLAVPGFAGAAQAFRIGPIKGDFHLDDGALHAKAMLSGALEGNLAKQQLSMPQWTLTLEGRNADAAVRGTISTSWSADLNARLIDWSRITADLQLPSPKAGALQLNASGKAQAHLGSRRASATLTGKLDESNFTAKLALNSFSPASTGFELDIDQLDADRYRASNAAPAGKGGPAAAAAPIDLSALRDLNTRGSVRVGALRIAGIKMNQVRLDLRAASGKLDIAPMTAQLYQGSVAGSLSVVAGARPTFAAKHALSNISVGPLLKDLAGTDRLEGRGNVVLDVSTQGATVSALEKALNGHLRLELRDGAVRGINLAQVLRAAKETIGSGVRQGSGSAADSTSFSEISGSFRITDGVARNDDLSLKSPLLRVAGSGEVDLANARLNYLVKTSIVSTLQGQGGPELQALRGHTVPVRLSGPFDKIGYRIDMASLAQELSRQKVEEKLKDKLPQGLGDKLKGLLGR